MGSCLVAPTLYLEKVEPGFGRGAWVTTGLKCQAAACC